MNELIIYWILIQL